MAGKKEPKNKTTEKQPKEAVVKKPAAKPEFERERVQFRKLVVANPNYFGNLKASPFQPVLDIQSNTFYEEIGCVGFQPQANQLEAVIFIKQPFGYGGDVCSNGTPEYVRFFLSFDNGVNWQDEGLTSFRAYNIPEGTEGVRRLEYAVTQQIDPPKKSCSKRNQALVRAILSWNLPPPEDDADFIPVWGEVHDTHIVIDPLKLDIVGNVLQSLKIKPTPELSQALDLTQMVTAPEPKALTVAERQVLYKDKGVPAHRFAFTEVQKLIDQPVLSESLTTPVLGGLLADLDLNLVEMIDKWIPVDGDTSFEELECVGLNPNIDTLIGTIRIKKPFGFSGNPCTTGSKEYVTFWADFDGNNTFETCLGTTSVNVYDIEKIPNEGLEYAVFLPVDLTHHRQPCKDGPMVVKIRAILSWEVPPPCHDPNYIPVWGNREETLIHIAPGPNIPPGTVTPTLSIVGGIPISMINNVSGMTTNDAIFAQNGLPPDPLGRPSPFGRRVVIQGPQFFGYKYRVQVRRIGEVSWTTVTTPLKVVDLSGTVDDHFPAPNGLFEYLPFEQNIANVLAWWDTTGDDLWVVRLQIFSMTDVLQPGVAWQRVQLDNTRPDADIHIDTGSGNCGKFVVGDTLTGHFVARDTHFRSYTLRVKPDINATGVGIPDPQSGVVQTVLSPGDPWELDTTDMLACGYIIEVVARDRSILNSSGPGIVHHRTASAGFCLEEPEE